MERLLSNVETDFSDIRENYGRICERVKCAMEKAGRTDKVRIMAVTKTVSPEKINYAVGLGIDLLGENRVQEFLEKRERYSDAEVHFIGTLQTNKVKYIIDKVSMIHSVDNLRLAEEIDRRARQHGLVMDILAEVNIGGEETKSGLCPENVKGFCGEVSRLEGVRLRGLMAIPPPSCGEDIFARMGELFGTLRDGEFSGGAFDTLSMGMSGDFETAVKYGATMIRIGSGLFGYRKYV